MVILGVREVRALIKRKCSSIGWPEKPSRPAMRAPSAGLHPGECDAPIHRIAFDAIKAPQEIEVPPGAAEFPVRYRFQAALFLLADDALDFAVFDGVQLGGGKLAARALGAGISEGGGAKQAPDMIGAERRLGALHGWPLAV